MKLGKMRWSEIQAYLDAHPQDASVIIPIGPVEEHGPHLPVGSDYASAERIAEIVAKRYHCLIFPVIPLMICGLSKETTGTYSVEPDTMELVARDLVSRLATKGFRNILFFTGHGGYSMQVIRQAVRRLPPSLEFRADIFNFEEACPEQEKIVGVDSRDMHAAGIETSRMLYLCPQDVRRDRIPEADYHSENNTILSQSGISGDPKKASRTKGMEIAEITVQRIISWFKA